MQKQMGRVGAAAGLAVLALMVTRCGTGTDESASSIKGGVVAVETEASVDLGSGLSRLAYGNTYVTTEQVATDLKAAVGRSLGRYGIVPTDLPEFFKFTAKLARFDGCDHHVEHLHCFGNFTASLNLKASAGPSQLADQSMTITFGETDQIDFNRRVRWASDRLIDDMVEQGLLAELGVETPYF